MAAARHRARDSKRRSLRPGPPRSSTCRWALARYLLLALITAGLVMITHGQALWLALLMPGVAVIALLHERVGLRRERDELLAAALSDPLTGLDNRRSLLSRADYEIVRHLRERGSFALVMIDLDGFKALNDRFGHDAGDELLCDVADALIAGLRAQDTVARLGGDEFCVLAPQTDRVGTPPLAARITRAIAQASVGVDTVRASVGVALFPQDGNSVAELMRVADQRLFAAKRARSGAVRDSRASRAA